MYFYSSRPSIKQLHQHYIIPLYLGINPRLDYLYQRFLWSYEQVSPVLK